MVEGHGTTGDAGGIETTSTGDPRPTPPGSPQDQPADPRADRWAAVADDPIWFETRRAEFAASVQETYGHLDDSAEPIRHAVAGSIKRIDALKLRAAVQRSSPTRILEVGSFLGFSTRVLLDAGAGSGAIVVSVDPRLRHRMFDGLKAHVLSFNPTDRLVCRDGFFAAADIGGLLHDYLHYEPRLKRRRALRKLSRIEVITEPFDEFDFVFIDGDHSFGATMANLALALRMARPGCVIAVHDALTWPSVVPAAEDVAAHVPGVRLLGVTAPTPAPFFGARPVPWDRAGALARLRVRVLGHDPAGVADGLCFLEVDPSADLEAVRDSCRAITAAFIAERRAARLPSMPREHPLEGWVPMLRRRAKLVVSDPRRAAAIARRKLVTTARRGVEGSRRRR